MKLFGYTLRKPWVRYETLELDIEDQLMNAINKSLAADLVQEILINDLCDLDCDAVSYLEDVVKP
jgi:hypothetical protein